MRSQTLCRDAAPDAVEQIKWGHPAYVHPDGVILFMFSGHKAYASFACTPTTRAAFEAELTHYRTGKGNTNTTASTECDRKRNAARFAADRAATIDNVDGP